MSSHPSGEKVKPSAAGTPLSDGDRPACSVLIVAYNSGAFIGECLRSIKIAATRCSYEVLLVDNGDGSTEALVRQDFPDVQIVPSKGNIGFAAGNNLLARHARSDMLLLLNPDMALFQEAMDNLLDGAKAHPEAAAWGGVTCDDAGKPDIGNTLDVPSLSSFSRFAFGKATKPDVVERDFLEDEPVDVLIGGFVMFSRRAWERASGLDEAYFLYCEEVDLFVRLAKMGERFWRIGKARGYHAIGHGQQNSRMRVLYRSAGTIEFTRRHWSPARRQLGWLLLWIGSMNRYMAGRLLGPFRPRLAQLSDSYDLVALKPWLWRHGYDPRRGLMAQLGSAKASS